MSKELSKSISTTLSLGNCFCASAMMHTARDVLPHDSGPKISTTLPRAMPPPSTESSVKHPVEIRSLQAAVAFGVC